MNARRAGTQHFARAAGVAVPLFALRGAPDTGSGEIGDVAAFADWLARWHQQVLQLLPINETAPDEASPYNTLSVFALDPAVITIAAVADAAAAPAAREWLATGEAAAMREPWRGAASPRQRPAVYAYKLQVLELGYVHFRATAADGERLRRFDTFCTRNADWLDDYALFRALKERYRWARWEEWPADLRDRTPVALATAAAELQDRTRFFRYLQWIADEQWAAARAAARRCGVLIKGDLPFVCGRDSADVWAHQDLFDLGSSAGAPPDDFSSSGQAWGLPLYDWRAMRRGNYAWWRQRVRQAAALYDLFRIDHVVGLYRTYAIAQHPGGTAGFVPSDEGEQLAQGRALLNAVLEEAAGTGVIAEDLGSVPTWVRESLGELGIPGYKVLRWERSGDSYTDPRAYAGLSVATTGTHDTDTLTSWWGTLSAAEQARVVRDLHLHAGDIPPNTELAWTHPLHLTILRRLYEAPSVLTILPLQDLFGWTERINTPGTTDPANWTFRCPLSTTALDREPEVVARMRALRDTIDATGRSGGAVTRD